MYGLTTLAKLNRQADEAARILNARHPGADRIIYPKIDLAPAPERLAKMNKLLDGAKG